MARSFDISRRRPSPPPISSSGSHRHKRSNSFSVVIFLIFAAIIGYLFISSRPKTSNNPLAYSSKITPSLSQSPSISLSPSSSPTGSPQNTSKPKIQILNGTGSTAVLDKVRSVIEEKGYPVSEATQAQYEYTDTYIYYRSDSVETAKTLGTILSAYKPTLSPSQISGLFDILIIVGKQNLPQSN